MPEKRFIFMLCFGCMTGHVHELKEDGWWHCPNCGHKRHTTPVQLEVENEEVSE